MSAVAPVVPITNDHEWIIQRCLGWKCGTTELLYEDWPEYSAPMTRDAALKALEECNKKYPFEFRAHRVRPVTTINQPSKGANHVHRR